VGGIKNYHLDDKIKEIRKSQLNAYTWLAYVIRMGRLPKRRLIRAPAKSAMMRAAIVSATYQSIVISGEQYLH
jgi:hypothetical protein